MMEGEAQRMEHWAELVDTICDLRGVYAPEFRDVARAVEIARHYRRDLRFPVLMQELQEDTLDTATLEGDGLLADDSEVNSARCPMVMALAFTAHALLHGDAGGKSELPAAAVEDGCRRVAAFVVIEKMRRVGVYATMSLPWDPWDDETPVVCEHENRERLDQLKRWLGYAIPEGGDRHE